MLKRKNQIFPYFTALLLMSSLLAIDSAIADTFYPVFGEVRYEGDSIVLNDNIRINVDDFSGFQDIHVHAERVKKWRDTKYEKRCKVPIPNIIKETYGGQQQWRYRYPLSCSEEELWISAGGYCDEGFHTKGLLLRYDRQSEKVEDWSSMIPDCESVVSIATRDKTVWFATVREREKNDPITGNGITAFNRASGQRIEFGDKQLKGSVIDHILYYPPNNSLWVVLSSGIYRFDLDAQQWEKRFFTVYINEDGKLFAKLSTERRISYSPSEHALYLNLYRFPELDGNAYAKVWNELQLENHYMGWPAQHEKLLPLYLDYLYIRVSQESYRQQWDDWGFSFLLGTVSQSGLDAPGLKTFYDHLTTLTFSRNRYKSLYYSAKGIGYDTKVFEEWMLFYKLFKKLKRFSYARKVPQEYMHLCTLVSKNVKYREIYEHEVREKHPKLLDKMQVCIDGNIKGMMDSFGGKQNKANKMQQSHQQGIRGQGRRNFGYGIRHNMQTAPK